MTSAPAGSVIVVGAVNADFVVAASRLPGPGETVVGPRLEQYGGGKGANAAVAAARAGAKVRLIGAVGEDDPGRSTVAELRADGVDVSGVTVLSGEATGVALIVVDPKGENQIAVGLGANAAVTREQVTQSLRDVASVARCVLVSTEIPEDAVVAAVEAAIAAGVTCVLNPAPVVPAVVRLLEKGPLLTPNTSELAALSAALESKEPSADGDGTKSGLEATAAAAGKLVERTRAPVVVTMGAEGALIVTPDGRSEHVPAPSVVVRDTTGAGDTFNGVLASRLASGDDLGAAVRNAIVAASISVGTVGARAGMPTAAVIAGELQSA